MLHKIKYGLCILLVLAVAQSCATYYEKAKKTESALLANNYTKAKKSIESNRLPGRPTTW